MSPFTGFFPRVQKISGVCCTKITCYSFQSVLQNMYFIITPAASSVERNWYGFFITTEKRENTPKKDHIHSWTYSKYAVYQVITDLLPKLLRNTPGPGNAVKSRTVTVMEKGLCELMQGRGTQVIKSVRLVQNIKTVSAQWRLQLPLFFALSIFGAAFPPLLG